MHRQSPRIIWPRSIAYPQVHHRTKRLHSRPLEDRTIPALITVTNVSDGAVDSAGQLPGSLRQAVFDANDESVNPGEDTIAFASGLTGVINLVKAIALTSDIQLVGPGSSKLTLDAGQGDSALDLGGGTAKTLTVSGLTVQHGKVTGTGGGMSSADVNATLTDVVIRDCQAAGGGAAIILFGTGSTVLNNCKILDNTIPTTTGVFVGGAVEVLGSQNVTFNDCVIDGNDLRPTGGSMAGGGIGLATTGSVAINRTSVTHNKANGPGGGLYVQDGTAPVTSLTITDSTFALNETGNSGGAIAFAGTATPVIIRNSTFSTNMAAVNGGGIRFFGGYSGAATVTNSTFALNTAGGNGGGLSRGNGTLSIESVVFSANSGASGPDLGAASGTTVMNSLISNATGATFTDAGGNLVNLAALLGPLADNGGTTKTHALLAGSPALDAGSNPAGLSFDQRGAGFARVKSSQTDIGAVENQSPSAFVTVTGVQVNDGSVQRSRLTALTVTFSEPVTFPTGINSAFQLNRIAQPTGGPSVGSPLGAVNVIAVQSGNIVTITFANGGVVPIDQGGSLLDGAYQLTVVAANVLGASGPLNGGANFVTPATGSGSLFRLFGDADGDRDVDAGDYGAFRSAFGGTSPAFDFDGDGDVDATDFGPFRQRFGVGV